MKNQFTARIVKLTFAFMFVLMASSCSDDNDAMDAAVLAKENTELAAKGGKVSAQSTFKVTTVTVADCDAGCISERVLFEDNTSDEIGKSGKLKTVNYQIWNTATQLILQTTSNVPTDKVLTVVNGVTYTNEPANDIPAGQAMYTYFELPVGYDACKFTLESVRVDGGGQQVELTGINYGVYVYCPEDCDESFSYTGSDGTYTFSYTPAESMSNALVVFTFAQAVAITGFDDTYSNNGQTFQKTMNLTACKTETWEVTLVKDCNGGAPNNNIWTDFKVGGISKKNSKTPNIVASCN